MAMAEPAHGGPGFPTTPRRGAFGHGQVFEDLTNTPSPLDRPEPALADAAAGPLGGRAPGRRQQRRRHQLQAAPMLPDYAMQPDYAASTGGSRPRAALMLPNYTMQPDYAASTGGSPQQLGARPAAAQPGQRRAAAPPGACVALRRYSLKSRRAAPYPVPFSPKDVGWASRAAPVPKVSLQTFQPPRAVPAYVQGNLNQCGCSRDPSLAQGRRRICLLNTDDHVEYQLLEAMGGRFAAETRSCGTSVAKRASMQRVQAAFIVQPQEGGAENVVGYVAMRPGGNGSAAECAPTLAELYVEPEFRRRGLATAALKVVLSGCKSVAVGPPAPEVAGDVLRGLGFKAVDARDSLLASCGGGRCDDEDEEHGHRVLFKRRILKKENQRV